LEGITIVNTAALFYRSNCGYCRKVISFMEKNNFSLTLKNTSESSEIREELITISGKTQVPCLVVNGQPIHESDDIIEWLGKNWSNDDHTGN